MVKLWSMKIYNGYLFRKTWYPKKTIPFDFRSLRLKYMYKSELTLYNILRIQDHPIWSWGFQFDFSGEIIIFMALEVWNIFSPCNGISGIVLEDIEFRKVWENPYFPRVRNHYYALENSRPIKPSCGQPLFNKDQNRNFITATNKFRRNRKKIRRKHSEGSENGRWNNRRKNWIVAPRIPPLDSNAIN